MLTDLTTHLSSNNAYLNPILFERRRVPAGTLRSENYQRLLTLFEEQPTTFTSGLLCL